MCTYTYMYMSIYIAYIHTHTHSRICEITSCARRAQSEEDDAKPSLPQLPAGPPHMSKENF